MKTKARTLGDPAKRLEKNQEWYPEVKDYFEHPERLVK